MNEKKKKTKPTSPSNAGPYVLLITIKCVFDVFFQSTLVDYPFLLLFRLI